MRFMITITSVFLALFFSGCMSPDNSPFDCFLGNWKVDFGEETYYETWSKDSNGNYLGEAFMFSAGDTTNYETFQLVKTNSEWNLSVNFEELESVDFKVSEISECAFKAVNPKNDFPQLISYSFAENHMSAYITNGEVDTVHFKFIKK